jgi:hypothetical protein
MKDHFFSFENGEKKTFCCPFVIHPLFYAIWMDRRRKAKSWEMQKEFFFPLLSIEYTCVVHGDEIGLRQNRPKCNPAICLSKLIHT